MAFFRLARASTYEWRSKKSGRLYVFSGDSIAKVEHADDLTRFRMLRQQFVETDEHGNMILAASTSSVPQAFSRHGMITPKSYAKLEKAAQKAEQAPPPPAPVQPAAQRAPRTVSSSKAAETAVTQAPAVSAPPMAKIVEEPAPAASAHVEEGVVADAPSSSAVATGAAAQSGPAPADGVPQARTRRRRSRGVAAQ